MAHSPAHFSREATHKSKNMSRTVVRIHSLQTLSQTPVVGIHPPWTSVHPRANHPTMFESTSEQN
jgi:hypothetical protein